MLTRFTGVDAALRGDDSLNKAKNSFTKYAYGVNGSNLSSLIKYLDNDHIVSNHKNNTNLLNIHIFLQHIYHESGLLKLYSLIFPLGIYLILHNIFKSRS